MTLVLLYGALAERFGREHRYDIRSPLEAVRALCSQHKGFRQYLVEHSEPGYRVLADDTALELNELHGPCGRVVRIVPVVAGADIGKVLLGASLIGFAIWNPLGWSSIGLIGSATVGSVMTNLGISMILGGIAGMLAKSPSSAGTTEPAATTPSYGFAGAVNTTGQGNPVPIGYGIVEIGSQVISAGLNITRLQ